MISLNNNVDITITKQDIEKFRKSILYETNQNNNIEIYYDFSINNLNINEFWGMSIVLTEVNIKDIHDSKKFNKKINEGISNFYKQKLEFKGAFCVFEENSDWRQSAPELKFKLTHCYVGLSNNEYQNQVISSIQARIKITANTKNHINDILYLLRNNVITESNKKRLLKTINDEINGDNNYSCMKIIYNYDKMKYFEYVSHMNAYYNGLPINELSVEDAIKTINILTVEKIEQKNYYNIYVPNFFDVLTPKQLKKYFGNLTFYLDNSSLVLSEQIIDNLDYLKGNTLKLLNVNDIFEKLIIKKNDDISRTTRKIVQESNLDLLLENLARILQYSVKNNVTVTFKNKVLNSPSTIDTINFYLDKLIKSPNLNEYSSFYRNVKKSININYKILKLNKTKYYKNNGYNLNNLIKHT